MRRSLAAPAGRATSRKNPQATEAPTPSSAIAPSGSSRTRAPGGRELAERLRRDLVDGCAAGHDHRTLDVRLRDSRHRLSRGIAGCRGGCGIGYERGPQVGGDELLNQRRLEDGRVGVELRGDFELRAL